MRFSREYKWPEFRYTEASLPEHEKRMEWKNVISEELFLQTLHQNPSVYIEPDYTTGNVPALASPLNNSAFVLSLTTLTCYRCPVAAFLCNTLTRHYGILPHTAMAIRTATHEAIANAVIHGNLGIHEHFEGLHAFKSYHARILSSLENPEYALRRITLMVFATKGGLTLRISDEGNGYTESYPSLSEDEFPLGKGLTLIHKHAECVSVIEGGRTIEMDFAF